MTKTQENNLCRDIGRIARSLERIASAVEKKNGGEKVEVIRCRDCKNWDISWESSCKGVHYCPMLDIFPFGDFWCKNGERKEEHDGQTDFTASCD